jgi:glycerol kinase
VKMILALDQGTTSSRAVLFDHAGEIRFLQQREFRQIYPKSGWVEHDAGEIWSSQLQVARDVIQEAGITANDIAAIGISNQRETAVLWDRRTGQPVTNAIVWQDRRTASYCDQLERDGCSELIRSKTGLVIDPYFAGTKLKWMLDHVAGARTLAEQGHLAFGTVDSWLLWNLTGGGLHVCDVTNASRTLLFNIKTGNWTRNCWNCLVSRRHCCLKCGPRDACTARRSKRCSAAKSRWPVRRAINRLLCMARTAHNAGWRRTRTAPVASC